MKYLILATTLLLAACGGSDGPPASGTVLSSSCDGYTLTESVADGNGGSTQRVTERSPECGWNPPAKGTVLDRECSA